MRTIILSLGLVSAFFSEAQNIVKPPLYQNMDSYNVLLKKLAPEFSSVLDDPALKNYFNFVLLSFEISENDIIQNIIFSKDFPLKIQKSISTILLASNSDWTSASINGIKIKKRIVVPLIFEKGNGIGKNFDVTQVSENLNIMESKSYDAIILPVEYFAIQQ